MGYVTRHLDRPLTSFVFRNAMAYGTALASFNVEKFGTEGVLGLQAAVVRERVEDLQEFTRFDHVDLALARARQPLATSRTDSRSEA